MNSEQAIKEAIEFFEKLVTKRTGYLNNCKSSESRTNRERLWVRTGTAALSALRAQQERENQKPCEYCFGVTPDDRKCWTVFKEKIVTINFCPLCGRQLEPKEAQK